MYLEKSIAVVVPAYNEEKLIRQTLASIPELVDRIIVVNDASMDGTSGIVKDMADNDPRVCLLEHGKNRGVGAAIVTGYKKALELEIDVTAVMAGDAQMDPDDLIPVIKPVAEGRADYVKGNRLITGEAWQMIPRYRYLGNAFLSLLTKVSSGYWGVADSQTGYTAISEEAIRLLPLEELYPRYGYPNHLLVMLNVFSLRVMDVPVRPVYGIGERSDIRLWKVIPRLSWMLTNCFFWRLKEKYIIRDFHPLVFFYLLGLTLFPSGLISGLYLFFYRIISGPVAVTSVLFSVFLFVSGLQSLFFAMWFDMEYNKGLKG